MDIVTLGAAKNYTNNHFVPGANLLFEENEDGQVVINASGEVSSEDTVARANISNHTGNKDNPHDVTKEQVGLGNVDNTADADKPISTAVSEALSTIQTAVTANTNKLSTVDTGANKTVVDASLSSSSINPVTNKAVTSAINNKANASDVYTKSETDSVITAKVSEIVAGAPEEFDTLKEMSDWLTEHEDSAAAMNTAIQANTKAIADNAEAIEANTTDIEQNTSDILTAKSDITINRVTLGTQRKNLLSVNDGTATRLIDETINQIEPGEYILSIGELTSTDTDNSICLCFFADNNNTQLSNHIFLERGTNISATATINKPVTKFRIYASNDWTNSDGDTVTASNIMLRPADVTDGTYEPYIPSINERLTANENDISLLEENKLNSAYFVAQNTTNTAGWFEVAKCDFVPSGSGNVRDIALCIQLTNANNTVGAKWAILNVATVIGGNSASWTIDTMVASFIVNKGFNTSDDNPDIVVVGTTDGTTVNLAIWCKLQVQHAYCRGIPLIDAARISIKQFNTPNYWQMLNTTAKYDSYPTDWERKIIPTDYYGGQLKSLSDRITALENK